VRDNTWLTEKLIFIHQTYFSDIIDGNEIEVKFGRANRTRLGSIAIREKANKRMQLDRRKMKFLNADEVVSIITINGYFAREDIPETVVEGILAHEFCHFVHGFNSMRPKSFRNPHAGGIIDQELKDRGFGDILKFQKRWIRKNWREYIKTHQ